eukprot:Gb_07080 [translate_table: standard]
MLLTQRLFSSDSILVLFHLDNWNMRSFDGHNFWSVYYRTEFVLFLFILLFSSFHLGMSETRSWMCNNGTTYSKGSKFANNLNRVLEDLVNKTSRTGFNTSSYGQSPNEVYGLLQCRGDISQQDCLSCSQEANTSIEEHCRNGIGGRVWLDMCFLRYEKYNFFSRLDTQLTALVNTQNVTNPDAFRNATWALLSNLTLKASEPANKGFATGTSVYSSFSEVYGLVQCWRDISAQDCRSCLKTGMSFLLQCCSQRQGAQSMLGSCTVRYEIYPFFNSAPSTPVPSPTAETPAIGGLNPSVEKRSKKSSKKIPIILGAIGGVLVALVIICLFAMRRKVKAAIIQSPITLRHDEVHPDVSESLIGQDQTIFTLEVLTLATANFSDDNKLGEGGFGPVYKGRTPDGVEIAVKKLSVQSGQGKTEFLNEVKLVAKIQHRNLVKLLGCCAEGVERLLVYEYLSNKSLDTFLFVPEKRRSLDWQKRYNIILGVARGLLYLHEDSQLRIIHRDIKANNILLDDKLNPKIADFGLARLFREDETHVHTRVAGTYGYMAPEYAMRGQLSVKADVYSFGVVLLEIISGRKNTDSNLPPEMQNIIEWIWRLYKRGQILDVIDKELVRSCPQEQALRCIHVGLLCVQADPALRPPISNVILMMSSNSVTLASPTKPAFVNISHSHNSKSSSDNYEDSQKDGISGASATTSSSASSHSALAPSSINDASISEMEPR